VELHTLENLRWNDNHQRPIKFWGRDIIESMRWLMRQPAYAEHRIYAPQRCFNCNTPPKHIYTARHTAEWWWVTKTRRDILGWCRANWCWVNAQSGGHTGSHDHHVWRNTTLEFCWWQDRVAWINDDWQSIFEDPPDALNTHCCNGCCPAYTDQEPWNSSKAAGWATVNTPTGAEQGTQASTPTTHL